MDDEDSSSTCALRMAESENDSIHSDLEEKESLESLSDGNYADGEDSQRIQSDSRRSSERVSKRQSKVTLNFAKTLAQTEKLDETYSERGDKNDDENNSTICSDETKNKDSNFARNKSIADSNQSENNDARNSTCIKSNVKSSAKKREAKNIEATDGTNRSLLTNILKFDFIEEKKTDSISSKEERPKRERVVNAVAQNPDSKKADVLKRTLGLGCVVKLIPLPERLIPNENSFVILNRQDLLKINVRQRFGIRKNKTSSKRRSKRRLCKLHPKIQPITKFKRQKPRDRSGGVKLLRNIPVKITNNKNKIESSVKTENFKPRQKSVILGKRVLRSKPAPEKSQPPEKRAISPAIEDKRHLRKRTNERSKANKSKLVKKGNPVTEKPNARSKRSFL